MKEAPVDVDQAQPADPGRVHRDRGPALLPPLGHRPARHRPARSSPTCAAAACAQGGSTITQQLAKTSFLSGDRTIKRKAQEVIIAFWLEAWLTKEEILSRYLSSVYFGDGVYGLRAAAHHYFNRDPEKLTPRPVGDARRHGAGALAARADPQSRRRAEAQPARARRRWPTPAPSRRARALGAFPRGPSLRAASVPTGTYFADWVTPSAQQAQSIPTTARSRCARRSTATCSGSPMRAVGRAPLGGAQAALVAMRPDGRVVAMVGGRTMRNRRSTAPPRRGASPARRSSCSSISPRCAPAGRPTA